MQSLASIIDRVGYGNLLAALVAVYLIYWIFLLMTDPLKQVPGPVLARYTKLWLLKQQVEGDWHNTNVQLHKRYGPLVRIAPNQYSMDDPEVAKLIYGFGVDFIKSEFYIPFGHPDVELSNLFNIRDPKRHSELRRRTASAYSMSSMVNYEPYVNECTTLLMQRLSEATNSGAVIDMGHWLQCYAFDTIAMISFSRRLGFLDAGEDFKDIMKTIDSNMSYSVVAAFWPFLHRPFITLMMKLSSEHRGSAFVFSFASNLISSWKDSEVDSTGPLDFVGKFMRIQAASPEKMPDRDIILTLAANMAAGSDTTSITLCGILYHLCKNPAKMAKLREELDIAARAGTISAPITFKEAQELPYLQAVLKESLRIHPAVGFTLPRIVPSEGRELMGHFFPAGTIVGINPWVANQNQAVFGSDASYFRPERWLEDKESSSKCESYLFTFGQGSRTCIGKNISLLEMNKAIPEIVRHLDFELENKGEWTCMNHFFAKPIDFNCRIKRRTL